MKSLLHNLVYRHRVLTHPGYGRIMVVGRRRLFARVLGHRTAVFQERGGRWYAMDVDALMRDMT